VQRDDSEAKFWLDPIRAGASHGFGPRELLRIEGLVAENVDALVKAWDEHFGN